MKVISCENSQVKSSCYSLCTLAPIELLHTSTFTAGCLHQTAGCLHQTASCLHQTVGCLHQTASCLHQTTGCLHQTAGCLHQTAQVMMGWKRKGVLASS